MKIKYFIFIVFLSFVHAMYVHSLDNATLCLYSIDHDDGPRSGEYLAIYPSTSKDDLFQVYYTGGVTVTNSYLTQKFTVVKDTTLNYSHDVLYRGSGLLSSLYNNGVCPEYFAAILSQNSNGDTNYHILELNFDNEKVATTVAGDDVSISISGKLSESRFNNTAMYNSFNRAVCLDENQAEYYTKMFAVVNIYKNNKTYLRMFANNGFSEIAKNIATDYDKGGKCYNKNPNQKVLYENMVKNAKQAMENMAGFDPTSSNNSCQYILGDPNSDGSLAFYIDTTFRFIKFLAPLLIIVFSTIDYIKAMVSSDAELVKKTNKKTIIRLGAALALFLLPIIISYLLTLLGLQGKCDFPNINGL